MNTTSNSNRIHIGIFGKRNSGKSSLINAISNQDTALVSEVAGTTTDAVFKPMEISGMGACVFIDTAGFDDVGGLGEKRVSKTIKVAEKTDIAIIVCTDENVAEEMRWINLFQSKNTPVIVVLNKCDLIENIDETLKKISKKTKILPIAVCTTTKSGVNNIIKSLVEINSSTEAESTITDNLAMCGDVVVLVMPQDLQAPKGRLILPQVQVIRELLDKKCTVVSCTAEKFPETLKCLLNPPNLIITDSQVFKKVYEEKPEYSKLTSFSMLFAKHKGDIETYIKGAKTIDLLTEKSHVLIAEACTHAPLAEDIGREKIPAMLRKKIGNNLEIDVVSGSDFPDNLSKYDLIIHCGACMFNKKYMLSRISRANDQHVPITNYGVCIAHLTGILDKVVY